MKAPSGLFAGIAAAALVSFGSVGCAHRPPKTSSAAAPPQAAGPSLGPTNPVEAAEPTMRTSLTHRIPELQTVHFAYDSAELNGKARSILVHNADWLKSHAEIKVQVAGYCDQRGTVEYNLALGQRRAQAAREYYARLGIAADRVATISYGKENLLCREMRESCWTQNRRAETLEALPQAVGRR